MQRSEGLKKTHNNLEAKAHLNKMLHLSAFVARRSGYVTEFLLARFQGELCVKFVYIVLKWSVCSSCFLPSSSWNMNMFTGTEATILDHELTMNAGR